MLTRERLRTIAVAQFKALRDALPDLLATLSLVVGWLLLTAGIAAVTSPVAWYFSLGLLGLALGGFKTIGIIAWYGLLALNIDEKKGANRG